MRNKLIAAGTGLLGFGALVGWAATADFYERRMRSNQQLLNAIIARQARELESTKDALLNTNVNFEFDAEQFQESMEQMREKGQSLLEAIQADEERAEGVEEDESSEDEEPFDPEKTAALRTNLQGLIDQYTEDPDEINHFNEITARAIENDERPPFVISREKYSWDEEEGDEYEKVQVTYYPKDRVLLDDEQDPVEDVGGLVGWRSLSQFGGESGDPDVVFVRNPRLKTDFEVVREIENQLPAHVRYSMSRDEFETNKAAGLIRFGREGRD